MVTPLVYQFDLPESVRQGRRVPASQTTLSDTQRQQDLDHIRAVISESQFEKLKGFPIPSGHMFFHSSFIAQVKALQVALVKAATDIVDRWFSDEPSRFTQRMPLEAHEEDLLKWIATSGVVAQYSGRQGLWRADLLLEQSPDGSIKPAICEVNARFPYNAWLLGASLAESLHEACNLAQVNMGPTGNYLVNEAGILGLYDQTKPLHVLMGESWKGLDVHDVMRLYKGKTGQSVRIVKPDDLQLVRDPDSGTGYYLACAMPPGDSDDTEQGTERVWQVSLEINQPELRPLDPLILRELARICVNDFRSVLLVNDQRFMAIIQEELESLVERSVINSTEATILRHGIVPTYLPSRNTWPSAVTSASKDSLIRKNTRGGEGKGHTFGHSVSQEEWESLLKDAANTDVHQLETTYAVQTKVMQVEFDLRSYEGDVKKRHVVGSFNSLHGKYHGLSGMRVAQDFVLSLQPGGGGLAMVAFTNVKED